MGYLCFIKRAAQNNITAKDTTKVEFILYLAAKLIALTLSAVSFCMLARMILSFFADPEGRAYTFFFVITEPFIVPVRFLLAKFNLLQDSPIDWSFTLTYLILSMVQMFLPII